MTSPKVCVDANIIVRLVSPTPNLDVEAYRQEWRSAGKALVAPALLRYEVVNSIHRMRLLGNVDDDLAIELLATAMEIPITFYDDDAMFTNALSFADRYKLKAAYDSHYLALSYRLGCDLWTTDKKFFNAVKAECSWVHLIGAS